MKINAVSSFILSTSGFTIMVLLCVVGVFAKRGCTTFGHSCFGGHGKRFDPQLPDFTFQGNEAPTSDNFQQAEAFPLHQQFVNPQQDSHGQQEILLSEDRLQASLRSDPKTFPSIVRQWLMSYHRLHHPENEFNNK